MKTRHLSLALVLLWCGDTGIARAEDSGEPKPADPARATELIASARRIMEEDPASAVRLLTEAIALDPRNDGAYILRGDAHWRVRTWESLDLALQDYAQAIAINPKNHVAYRKRGDVRRETLNRDIQGALADYETALEIVPDDPVTLCHRGTLFHYSYRRTDLAEADFRKALELRPEYHQALNNLGYLAAEKGELDTAISYYARAIKSSPDYPFSYANRGYAFLQKEEFERALTDLDKALQLRPSRSAFIDRGDTKAAMGNFAGAVADYMRAIELDEYLSGFVGAYSKRGAIYKQMGEDEKAQKDFERAKELEFD